MFANCFHYYENNNFLLPSVLHMPGTSLNCYHVFHTSLLWTACLVMLVSQSCLTLCDPMDCSPPGSSVHGIIQARILQWVAMPFSRRSSEPRDWTPVSSIAGRFFTVLATREAQDSLEAGYYVGWPAIRFFSGRRGGVRSSWDVGHKINNCLCALVCMIYVKCFLLSRYRTIFDTLLYHMKVFHNKI